MVLYMRGPEPAILTSGTRKPSAPGGMAMRIRTAALIFRDAAVKWRHDNVSHLAAGLSYYTIFSLAPILVVSIALAGFVFGREAAESYLNRAGGDGAGPGLSPGGDARGSQPGAHPRP